ncbi:MAG: penicillin acylase family protein [Candidatus Kapaibacteriales bacterium]
MKIREKRLEQRFAFVSFIIVILLTIYFSINFAKISLIEGGVNIECNSLYSKCLIYKNRYGITHIVGEEDLDVFFGFGFAQASDRLWQMDYLRRTALGELSEIFGKETIAIDKFFRSLEISATAEKIIKSLDPNSFAILKAYSDGVNAYVYEFSNRLPLEFNTLGYKPKPWKPSDCIAIGRLMAFSLNFSFWLDLTYTDIANKIGYQNALKLLPTEAFYPQNIGTNTVKAVLEGFNNKFQPLTKDIRLTKIFDFLSEYIFPQPTIGGSNTWAISTFAQGKRSAILASDPHLTLRLPPLWYQSHISSKTFNVVGLFIPGIPLPLIGRNDNIAWGITNAMLDDCDFFAYTLDSIARFVLDSSGKRIKIRSIPDTIFVKNLPPVAFYRRYIGSDPIVSDFLLMKDTTAAMSLFGFKPEITGPNFCLTYKWTAKFVSNEVRALYEIAKARNWNEFIRLKNFWGAPALNFSYADKYGNIGIISAGFLPIRINVNPNFINFSSFNNSNWVGVRKFPDEFVIYNPKSGYIFNSNNPITQSKIFLSHYWSDPFRARRLNKLLSEATPKDIPDNQLLQNDIISEQAMHIFRIVLPILISKEKYLDDVERKALSKLMRWNYSYSSNEVEPSIAQMFITKLIESTFKDELGESLFKQFTYIDFIPTRVIVSLLSDTSSIFFDDVKTKEVEDKQEVVFRSFKRSISELRKIFDDKSLDDWKYGKWHRVEIEHPFARFSFLRPSFSLPSAGFSGNNSTISYAGGRMFEPGRVEIAPSARFLADLSDTLVWMILPGGNSGQNVSANFNDQFNLWLNGSYIPVPVSSTPSPRFRLFATCINSNAKNHR